MYILHYYTVKLLPESGRPGTAPRSIRDTSVFTLMPNSLSWQLPLLRTFWLWPSPPTASGLLRLSLSISQPPPPSFKGNMASSLCRCHMQMIHWWMRQCNPWMIKITAWQLASHAEQWIIWKLNNSSIDEYTQAEVCMGGRGHKVTGRTYSFSIKPDWCTTPFDG